MNIFKLNSQSREIMIRKSIAEIYGLVEFSVLRGFMFCHRNWDSEFMNVMFYHQKVLLTDINNFKLE